MGTKDYVSPEGIRVAPALAESAVDLRVGPLAFDEKARGSRRHTGAAVRRTRQGGLAPQVGFEPRIRRLLQPNQNNSSLI